MKHKQQNPLIPPSGYLTVDDVRSFLNISSSKAYELVHSKGFPVCRLGGSIRVPREPFLAWVAKNTYIPADLASA